MAYRALALVTIALHFAYLLFIPLGGFLAWRWRRIVPVHLAAIVVAVASVTVHFDCPLTTLQDALERRAGGHPRGDFIDRYIVGHVLPSGHDRVIQLVVVALIVSSYAFMPRSRVRPAGTRPIEPDAEPEVGTTQGRTPTGRRSGPSTAR